MYYSHDLSGHANTAYTHTHILRIFIYFNVRAYVFQYFARHGKSTYFIENKIAVLQFHIHIIAYSFPVYERLSLISAVNKYCTVYRIVQSFLQIYKQPN